MDDLAEKTLPRSGSSLHYWLGGPAGRPLVTLTHGATMDHRMFAAQIPALASAYRVWAWDVRGHGRSQPLGTNFSIAAAAEDLLAILSHEGIEQAVFVRQSMGAYIAQEIVFRQPEQALALVTIGVTSITRGYPWTDALALALTPAIVQLWPYEHLKRYTAAALPTAQPATPGHAGKGHRPAGASPKPRSLASKCNFFAGRASNQKKRGANRLELFHFRLPDKGVEFDECTCPCNRQRF